MFAASIELLEIVVSNIDNVIGQLQRLPFTRRRNQYVVVPSSDSRKLVDHIARSVGEAETQAYERVLSSPTVSNDVKIEYFYRMLVQLAAYVVEPPARQQEKRLVSAVMLQGLNATKVRQSRGGCVCVFVCVCV